MAKKLAKEVTREEMIAALKKQGVRLFDERSGLPLNQAQRNLQGRTHYVDDSTLKSFAAKIHSVYVLDDGLLLGMVESLQKGFSAEDGRVFRPVFFDIFGNVVKRPDIDGSFDSVKKAQSEFWKQSDELDAEALTIAGLEEKIKQVERDLTEWQELHDEIA